MLESNLQKQWKVISSKLGLEVEMPFEITLSNEKMIPVEVLLKNFGAKNGICIVSDYEKISEFADEIYNAGFGFSTLSDPEENEIVDIESIKEMLRDWGWSGIGEKPNWL